MSTTARGIEIDRSDVPVRLFESDFLEWFTHISPVAVLIVWVPVVVFFLVRAVREVTDGARWWSVPAAFVLGLAVWTFAEYGLHRFLFHYEAKGARARRVFFLFHGVHHAQPQLKTRLVMPPAASIPLALVFYWGFALVIGRVLNAPGWVAPLFSGFITGYLLYDMTHYATHHLPLRSGYLRSLKRRHMAHHFTSPDALYGVSSPVWDYVFGTAERGGAAGGRNSPQ
jgi:sterol desaturase/sphingolipid hydroxylase (fatty acid hydroxylase superfamily)